MSTEREEAFPERFTSPGLTSGMARGFKFLRNSMKPFLTKQLMKRYENDLQPEHFTGTGHYGRCCRCANAKIGSLATVELFATAQRLKQAATCEVSYGDGFILPDDNEQRFMRAGYATMQQVLYWPFFDSPASIGQIPINTEPDVQNDNERRFMRAGYVATERPAFEAARLSTMEAPAMPTSFYHNAFMLDSIMQITKR